MAPNKDLPPLRPSSSVVLLSPSNEILLLHRVKTSTAFASAQLASQQAPSPFTLAEEAGEAEFTDTRAVAADGDNMLGTLRVQSSADIVMRTNEHGQLIICCPPGTTVVNSQASSGDGVTNVSPNPCPPHSCKAKPQRLTLKKTNTGVESSSSSYSILRSELSVCYHGYPYPTTATNPMKENAVASVSAPAAAVDVESSITTWLDHGEGGQGRSLTPSATASSLGGRIQTALTDGVMRRSSRFVHRDTDLAEEREEMNGSSGFVFESQSPVPPFTRLSGSGSSLSSPAVSPTLGQSLVSSTLSAALPLVSIDTVTSFASGPRSSATDSGFSTTDSGSTSATASGFSTSESGSASATASGFSTCDSGSSASASASGSSASASASGSTSNSDACVRDDTFRHAASSISSVASDVHSTMQSTSALDIDDASSSSSSSSSFVARTLPLVETSATKSSVLSSDARVATSSDFNASLSSDSATSQFTQVTSLSTTANASAETLPSSTEHSVSSPSLALSTGRSVHYLDPSVDDSRAVDADTLSSDSDVAGIASPNVQDSFTPADLITAMQTVITRTLAAAYMQSSEVLSSRTATRPNRNSARASRVYNSSLPSMMITKPVGCVSVVC
ncbi:hypothetical protein NQ176_g3002 [Zarea fungicola]|uniref:Uncharacterized protein n=1 Tax=Zarea fungicola TaxID=93591 RepID=A0ACC1NNB9_9HYPO|nr:hypothetical protein NQ176_g3002 [Lecanicillium fungicola]